MLTGDIQALWDAFLEQMERLHRLEDAVQELRNQVESLRH